MSSSVKDGNFNFANMSMLEDLIMQYRENDDLRHSPVWLWFSKQPEKRTICLICDFVIHRNDYSTGQMMQHLERHHGATSAYDAWIICEELMELKKLRGSTYKHMQLTQSKTKRERKEAHSKFVKKAKEMQLKAKRRKIAEDLYNLVGDEAEEEEEEGPIKDERGDDVDADAETFSNEAFEHPRQAIKLEVGCHDSPPKSTKHSTSAAGAASSASPGSTAFALTSSSTPPSSSSHVTFGIPRSAKLTTSTAPVHVDVGGTLYTTSLETLTKFPRSRLGRLFNGELPIVLDSVNNRYFIDRDGRFFIYILNFCRSSKLTLPDNFNELELLYEEALFYEISPLVATLQHRMRMSGRTVPDVDSSTTKISADFECVSVHIWPEAAGEHIFISALKDSFMEAFPELTTALDHKRNAAWIVDNEIMKFPVSEFCNLTSLQVIRRLLQVRFTVTASSGGGGGGGGDGLSGPEGRQTCTEYLLSRKLSLSVS